MKFLIKLTVFLGILVFSLSSFIITSDENSEDYTIFSEKIIPGNSCTLFVKKSSGSPARSVKVTTDVSGGISCIGGRSFYTDSDGEVTLQWVSGCYLKKIYIDGKTYEVNYENGRSYTINMR